mmetsp:Transcript_11009/g.32990  ORF Transcript_11009/g.32990 Transcript_11009/m.32990 type:complete len:209 (-) Transcript_11009:1305-1931(-)
MRGGSGRRRRKRGGAATGCSFCAPTAPGSCPTPSKSPSPRFWPPLASWRRATAASLRGCWRACGRPQCSRWWAVGPLAHGAAPCPRSCRSAFRCCGRPSRHASPSMATQHSSPSLCRALLWRTGAFGCLRLMHCRRHAPLAVSRPAFCRWSSKSSGENGAVPASVAMRATAHPPSAVVLRAKEKARHSRCGQAPMPLRGRQRPSCTPC